MRSMSTTTLDGSPRAAAWLVGQGPIAPAFLIIGTVLAGLGCRTAEADNPLNTHLLLKDDRMELQQFQAIYEPSGAEQLPDGRIVMVGDENTNPLSMLVFDHDGKLAAAPIQSRSPLATATGKAQLGKLSDLEGVAVSDQGYIYAITSHSRRASGKRSDAREKLVRFKLDGDEVVEPGVISDLRKIIAESASALKEATRVSDVKDGNGFNIEGLSFDKAKERLLIGLRSPVIDDDAVIVVMENPVAAFENDEKPNISDELIYLDLDKGGIRAITFDPKLNGYLIVSRREDKRKKLFKLWLWDGDTNHSPRRIRVDGHRDFRRAEGITPIRHRGREWILMVFDDGDASKREGAHYLLLDYERLEIEP